MRTSLLLMAVAGAAVVIAMLTTSSRQDEVAELILTNAAVYTVNPDQPRAEALAVRQGVIVAVGSEEEVSRYKGRSTTVIDLDGAFVVQAE